jgi:maltose O-acetyltransferase
MISPGRFLVYCNNHLISRVVLSWVRLAWYRFVMGFRIGPSTSILTDFKVSGRGNLIIGRNTVVNNSCRFDNRFPIVLGDNVSVTYGTMILTKGHDIDASDFRTKGAPVEIGDYVWICARATILPGVKLGKGCVVLTGAVVTEDVPEYHVVGGNPARFVRKRSTDLGYDLRFDPWVPFFG